MSDNIAHIQAELESLGYETFLFDSKQGKVVAFRYRVEVGSHKDKSVTLGISMHGSGAYPEYPPHWIHIHPPVDDGKGGTVISYNDDKGQQWIAMSRPPGQLWDELPTKHMAAYLSEHIRRFWNNI